MKRNEEVIREILYQAMEKKNRIMTQAEIARKLAVSLSIVNSVIKTLERMGALELRQRSFHVIDIKKILYYWASIRDLQKEVIAALHVDMPIRDIERHMPDDIVFAAYSAYKLRFDDVPADYSEAYVYGDSSTAKLFKTAKGTPNLFILKKDGYIHKYGKTTTIAQTFVDLWNIKEWYAKEFLNALEARLNGILE